MQITRIAWARLSGERPRPAGCNARLGVHGQTVSPGVAWVWDNEGAWGWGWSRVSREQAEGLLGADLSGAYLGAPDTGACRSVAPDWRALEYPLLDLAARREGLPVYAWLAGQPAPPDAPLDVPCYDTSLYMDDLHLARDEEAAALMADEMRQGWERGHRAFKLKVGRGAMHMPIDAGTRRDIAMIRAVRRAAGPDARLMCDANNGYTLNLLKHVLAEIADGEGDASRHLLEWARDGLVDVVQHDVLNPGFSHWLELGPRLDTWGARSAPHHYGEPLGNYYACHLAPAIAGMEAVEWDEAALKGVDASGYRIQEGRVTVPWAPGFGLQLDPAVFDAAVSENGWRVAL